MVAKQKDETPLEIGNVVYLRSGSQKMTIVEEIKRGNDNQKREGR